MSANEVIDADAHVVEPADLWRRYIEPRFLGREPVHDNARRGTFGVFVEGRGINSWDMREAETPAEQRRTAADRLHTHVSEAAKAVATKLRCRDDTPIELTAPTSLAPPRPQTQAAQQSLQRRARRLERYQYVIKLHQQGVSLRAIARREGMHRSTVRRWVQAGSFPERPKRRRRSRATASRPGRPGRPR